MIGGDVVVTVRETHGGRIRLAIEAPSEVLVMRKELIGEPSLLRGMVRAG